MTKSGTINQYLQLFLKLLEERELMTLDYRN
jgi:hypothetical protein